MSNQKEPRYKCIHCVFKGTFQELCIHEEFCENVKVICSFEGCNFECIRKDMEEHEKSCKIGELYEEIENLKRKNQNLELKNERLEENIREKDGLIQSLQELILETQVVLKQFKK